MTRKAKAGLKAPWPPIDLIGHSGGPIGCWPLSTSITCFFMCVDIFLAVYSFCKRSLLRLRAMRDVSSSPELAHLIIHNPDCIEEMIFCWSAHLTFVCRLIPAEASQVISHSLLPKFLLLKRTEMLQYALLDVKTKYHLQINDSKISTLVPPHQRILYPFDSVHSKAEGTVYSFLPHYL